MGFKTPLELQGVLDFGQKIKTEGNEAGGFSNMVSGRFRTDMAMGQKSWLIEGEPAMVSSGLQVTRVGAWLLWGWVINCGSEFSSRGSCCFSVTAPMIGWLITHRSLKQMWGNMVQEGMTKVNRGYKQKDLS